MLKTPVLLNTKLGFLDGLRRSYQLCLQFFCQEEFLRRLEKSKKLS